MQLLAKDPADRYASAEDLRADLRNFLEGLPVAALSSRAAVAAGIVAGGVAAAAVAAGATQAVPSVGSAAVGPGGPADTGSYVAPGPDPEAKRSTTFLWVLLGVLVVLAIGLFVGGLLLSRSGSQQLSVPDVTQQTQDQAIATLSSAGFKVDPQQENNADVAVGVVFDQSPRGGQKADKGSTVTIKVSNGLGQGQVPSVIGSTKASATSLLENNGFKVNAVTQNDPNAPVDQVIDQTPKGGEQADKGSTVTIVVSGGPATVVVPDVTGQTSGTASANLIAAGFKVKESSLASSKVAAGVVISTNPSAGVAVEPGTTVTIVVSTGPAPTTSSSTTSTTKASTSTSSSTSTTL